MYSQFLACLSDTRLVMEMTLMKLRMPLPLVHVNNIKWKEASSCGVLNMKYNFCAFCSMYKIGVLILFDLNL